jgi:hypothetical protein
MERALFPFVLNEGDRFVVWNNLERETLSNEE